MVMRSVAWPYRRSLKKMRHRAHARSPAAGRSGPAWPGRPGGGSAVRQPPDRTALPLTAKTGAGQRRRCYLLPPPRQDRDGRRYRDYSDLPPRRSRSSAPRLVVPVAASE
ncbi:hypothetical protein [Lysobacter gummosus]|uniref:hypothetical protein n=1 Tax=Lysobacter gummosus TaxID=262324 RepID=UPI003635D56E